MTFKDNVKDEIIIEKIIMDANPGGTTHATPVLNKSYELYKKYEEDNESQKTLLLVFTDWEFSDGAKAEQKIVEIRKDMQENNADTDDFKIVFLQFWDDRFATKYLQHLDDDLCHQNYDIVDVKTVDYISQRIKQWDSYGDIIIDCITENND